MFIDKQREVCKPSSKKTESVPHDSKDNAEMVYMPSTSTNTSSLPTQQQYNIPSNIEQQRRQKKRQQEQHHVSFNLQ